MDSPSPLTNWTCSACVVNAVSCQAVNYSSGGSSFGDAHQTVLEIESSCPKSRLDPLFFGDAHQTVLEVESSCLKSRLDP